MQVKEIMTSVVQSLTPDSTIGAALEFFEAHEVRHIPVTDDGELLGLVTERVMEVYLGAGAGQDVLATRLGEIMEHNVVTVTSDSCVQVVIDNMLQYKVGALPVMDSASKKIVGIVSYLDVLKASREYFTGG